MEREMTEVEDWGLGQAHADVFRLLVESVRDYAIFLLDTTGHIRSWNEGARRIKGYTPQEIIGKHFSIFYPAADVRHGKPDFGLKVAVDEGRWQEEGWRIRKDGTRFWASVVITALFEEGKLVGFAKVTRDLTERKRVEEERTRLLELEHAARTQAEMALERVRIVESVTEAALSHLGLDELLNTLLERIVESLEVDTAAILLLDEDEGNVLVARAAKGIEEEVEQGVRIPVGKGFAGRIAAERQPVVLSDVEHSDVMNPLLRKKGIRSMLGVPLMIEQHVLGVLHVGSLHQREFRVHDVQLLQIVADRVSLAVEHARLIQTVQIARHDAELAEATVRARDEFLTIAAHELKTPLTSLRLATQTVRRRVDQGGELDLAAFQRSLQTVDRQTDRLARLVTQLLETVRAQAGRLEREVRRTELVDLVRVAVETAQPQGGQHHIVFHAAGQVWATIDPLRFEQVVVNLIDNAVKFSPEGGQIDVDLEGQTSGAIRFAVRDRGIGVSPEHRAHLFERFYRAHGPDHRSGMGLGLYISREIVEMHGGRIEAEFPPDGGTRVVVELPADVPADVPADAGGR